jgi:hypothetical protein
MAESQNNTFNWGIPEDFSCNVNNPEYNSDFPGLDFEAFGDFNFATSFQPDAPLDSTETAPQENHSNLGDVEFDAFLNMSQFEEQETGTSQPPKEDQRLRNSGAEIDSLSPYAWKI